MIDRLVESAFRTGCLSVASEGLIRQVLEMRGYQSADVEALERLHEAICQGRVKREGAGNLNILPLSC
jgi:hypothetical protein